MKKINIKAFTFVELIVVIVILAILGAIGFTSYISYIGDSRDSQRKTDLSQIGSGLKIYKQKRGYYPLPGENFNIQYSGATLALQGKLDTNVRINSLEIIPLDPKTKTSYLYSITNNKQEFEIAATLENEDKSLSILDGNYKSVSKNILPTILLATGASAGSNIEIMSGTIDGDINRKLFIYNFQNHNLPYDFVSPYEPVSDGTSFDVLLNEVETNATFWQNSDYRNCIEISEAGKLLIPLTAIPFEYQIITETGALVNTGCTL